MKKIKSENPKINGLHPKPMVTLTTSSKLYLNYNNLRYKKLDLLVNKTSKTI